MNIGSSMSGHWTDEQLIAHHYGVGPENDHLARCICCQQRLITLQSNRQELELAHAPADEVSFDFLAAQRRNIYRQLSDHTSWARVQMRRLASAAATVLILGGGLFVYEQKHRGQIAGDKVSDVQLAQEMSQLSQSVEPESTAPLQALFTE